MVREKQYLTGGLGSRWDGEAFGDPYELPTDRAYAETCAAIGGMQWAWRMLLATGEALYADQIERMLYNGFLSGVSLGGTEYFYVNPLQLRRRRPRRRGPQPGARPARLVRLRLLPAQHHAHVLQPGRLSGRTTDGRAAAAPVRAGHGGRARRRARSPWRPHIRGRAAVAITVDQAAG